ncbi:diguanylate cyclase [Stappia sp. BW2]|uniref:diguanylate cyclase domain-containing protein n=1 Tax=Stappia sp. BW2 TaxID=2592622 RepID=UPI0011DEBF84|nr:diguanylate cyclase [Stappia sp. BW2]TYC66884.1 diguanylate cyclase [Stappia sp. BW2]
MFHRKKKTPAAVPPELDSPKAGRRITVWIYSFAALLIFLSTASLTFIAQMAWGEADRRALEAEQLQLTRTLNDFHRQIARDQITVAQWDETFNALQAPLDREFIAKNLVGDLWDDFNLDRTFVVTPDGTLIAQAFKDDVLFENRHLKSGNPIRKLAERTTAAFRRHQNGSNSVLADWYVPQSALLETSQSAFAVIDGTRAFVSTMPILPDEGVVQLEEPYPAILINATYIDEDWLSGLREQLGYKDLRFYPGEPERRQPTNYLLQAADGSTFGYFRWDHSKPGREIWMMALPLIVLLASFIAIVAFALATKISRLSASLEESERKNRYFARHDALTGLPNRHHFSDTLAFALDGLPDRGFAIFACDLDRFKPVNDTYGHEAGDKVICTVADRLKLLVSKIGVVSRIGGDEFIILLTRQTDRDRLAALAADICRSIAEPIDIGSGQKVGVGVSIGIASAPESGMNEQDLIRGADMALYRAKEKGRNTFEFSGPYGLEAAKLREHLEPKVADVSR